MDIVVHITEVSNYHWGYCQTFVIQYSHLGSVESGIPPIALIILVVMWAPPTLLSYTACHARVVENLGYSYGGYSVSIFPLVLPTLSSASDRT